MINDLQNIHLVKVKAECQQLQNNQRFDDKLDNQIQPTVSHMLNIDKTINQNKLLLKSVLFFVRSLMHRSMKALKLNMVNQPKRAVCRKYFDCWRLLILISRVEKSIVKRRFFNSLSLEKSIKQLKNIHQIKLMTAENCYERCLRTKVFYQWKMCLVLNKKEVVLKQLLTSHYWNRFCINIDAMRQSKFAYNIAKGIHIQKSIRQHFQLWKAAIKIQKLQICLTRNRLRAFVKTIHIYNKDEKQKYQKLYKNKLVSNSFIKLNINRLEQKSIKHHKRYILSMCFKIWVAAQEELFFQKQKEHEHEQTLKHYLIRKQRVTVLYSFNKWKQVSRIWKQNRIRDGIVKQFGQIQEKHGLLKKYFEAMRQHLKISKSQKFYNKRLKQKTINTLKYCITKSSQKLNSLYNYVLFKEKGRYFKSIIKFIQIDKQKIRKHLLLKFWNLFTYQIVKSFISNKSKAQQYYAQSLIYRSFFVLKEATACKQKLKKVLYYVNVNMNLKRWAKGYKIRQFVIQRHLLIMRNVFLQLKLMRLNKIWSEPLQQSNVLKNGKIASATTKKLKIYQMESNRVQTLNNSKESLFYLQKIQIESPEKLINLDYSISEYYSNNVS